MTADKLAQNLYTTARYLLAAQYTRRYQEIVMQIPPHILFRREEMTAEDWKGEHACVASTVHAYIDLCAEELRLHKAGQIPDEVWQAWDEGIKAGMGLPAVRSLFDQYFKQGPYNDLRQYVGASQPTQRREGRQVING